MNWASSRPKQSTRSIPSEEAETAIGYRPMVVRRLNLPACWENQEYLSPSMARAQGEARVYTITQLRLK
jgi:hypothetical protein